MNNNISNQIKHNNPLSSKNISDINDLISWYNTIDKNYDIIIEDDVNGLPVAITYNNGILVSAVTCDDNCIDITENIQYVYNLPHKLYNYDFKGKITIYCKIYIPVKQFETLNKQRKLSGQSLFNNPYIVTSDSLLTNNPEITKEFGFHAIAFNIIYHENQKNIDCIQSHQLTWLENNNFETVSWFLIKNKNISDIKYTMTRALNKINIKRKSKIYPVDSAIIRINNLPLTKDSNITDEYLYHTFIYQFKN